MYTPAFSVARVYQLIIEAYDVAGNVAVAGPFGRTVTTVPTPTSQQIYLPLISRTSQQVYLPLISR